MANDWDTIVKLLIGSNPQHFVSLLLPEARYERALDKELKTRTIQADLLYEVMWQGRSVVLHVEFQRRRDGDMGRRMWEYNALTTIQTQLPTCSFVLYLLPDGNMPASPYEISLPDDSIVHSFNYHILKLWEVESQELEQPGREGMLPLLPLTRDGTPRERVERMISDLQNANMNGLLSMAYSIAALAFPGKEDKDWLKRRFDMLKDIIEESWAYKEMYEEVQKKGLEDGMEKGKIKTLREAIVDYAQARFPQQESIARAYVDQINSVEALNTLKKELYKANTAEEVTRLLSPQ